MLTRIFARLGLLPADYRARLHKAEARASALQEALRVCVESHAAEVNHKVVVLGSIALQFGGQVDVPEEFVDAVLAGDYAVEFARRPGGLAVVLVDKSSAKETPGAD